jgi:hypothetical protein
VRAEQVTYMRVTFGSIAEALAWAKRADADKVAPYPDARFKIAGRMTLATIDNYQRAVSIATEANARALERADKAALIEALNAKS